MIYEVRSTFSLVAVAVFIVAMRMCASGLMNVHICTVLLYFVQLAVTSRHKTHHCIFKNNWWIKIYHQLSSSQVQFLLPNFFFNIAKSVRNFGKNYRDLCEHWQRCAHHILQLHTSSCTDMSNPGGRNQLLPQKFRGVRYWACLLDRNTVQFIYALYWGKCRW